METIIAALIGMVAPLVAAVLVYRAKKKEIRILRKQRGNLEQQLEDKSHGLVMDLQRINIIQATVNTMFANSNADRFLILIGRNGKSEFRLVSAIYEQHKATEKATLSIGATNTYDAYRPDRFYLDMLKEAEHKSPEPIHYVVDEMPDSDLKGFYKKEQVKESNVYHLLRTPKNDVDDLLVFGSVATHSSFKKENQAYLKTQVSRIAEELKRSMNE